MTTNIATKHVKRTQPPLDITRPFMDDIGAFARTTPPNTRAGRYRAPDSLLAFLTSL